MHKLSIILMFICTTANAESTVGHISVGVVDIGQLSQQENGQVNYTGVQPEYCDTDNQGNITCDF